MAIVIDASSPAGATTTTTACTTASFTPAANSLLVALGAANNNVAGVTPTGAVTDSLSSTWTRLARQNAVALGCAEIWVLDAGASPAARTVTMTSSTTKGAMIAVLVLTGAANVAGQTGTPVLQGTTAMQAAITTPQAGSLVVGAEDYAFTSTTLTLNGSTTLTFQARDATNSGTYSAIRATATTVTPGAITIGFTDTGFAAAEMALLEILPTVTPSIGLAPSRDYYPGQGPRRNVGTRFKPTNFATDAPPAAPNLGSWVPGFTIPRRSLRRVPTFRTNSGTDVPESLLPPSSIKRATPGRRQYALRRPAATPEPIPAQATPAAPAWVPGLRVARRLSRNRPRAALGVPVTAQDSAPGTTRRPRPGAPSRRLRAAQLAAPQTAPVPLVARVRMIARLQPRARVNDPVRPQVNPPIVQTVFGRLRAVGRIQPRTKTNNPTPPQLNPPVAPKVIGRLRAVGRIQPRAKTNNPTPPQLNPPIVSAVFGRLRAVGRVKPRPRVGGPVPAQQAAATNPSITATVFGRLRTVGRTNRVPRIVKPIPAQVNPPIVPTVTATIFNRVRFIDRIKPRPKVGNVPAPQATMPSVPAVRPRARMRRRGAITNPLPQQATTVTNPPITATVFGRLRAVARTNRIPRIVKPIPAQVNPPYPVKPSRVAAFRGTSRRRAASTSSPQVQPTAVTRTVPVGGLRGFRRVWLKIRRKTAAPIPGQVTTLEAPLSYTDSFGDVGHGRDSGTVTGGKFASTPGVSGSRASSAAYTADPDADDATHKYDSDSDTL